tara:strand:- start:176 stop:1273 length:1098 start_codon:yes stop_codon:yes gene_type:complete
MSRARTFADLATASEAGNLGQTNLIINGDMSVAQRGTSSTSDGFYTVDRWSIYASQTEITQTQQSLTSGSPYELGFNNFARMAVTSASNNAGAYAQFQQPIEAQFIANSGWNFKSSSSFVTLSFWARSSLAGTYFVFLQSQDGTTYIRAKDFALSADTWTKASLTFEGNSNLTINDDNGVGLYITIVPHYGTTYTGSGGNASTTTWYTISNNKYLPTDFAQNWGNTSSATFDITGCQLELGQVATPYKHESFADNLKRCRRYYQQYDATNAYTRFALGVAYDGSSIAAPLNLPIKMRAAPTFASSGNFDTLPDTVDLDTFSVQHATADMVEFRATDSGNGLTTNRPYVIRSDNDTSAKIQFISEL